MRHIVEYGQPVWLKGTIEFERDRGGGYSYEVTVPDGSELTVIRSSGDSDVEVEWADDDHGCLPVSFEVALSNLEHECYCADRDDDHFNESDDTVVWEE